MCIHQAPAVATQHPPYFRIEILQTRGHLNGLADAPGQINELQEFVVFAPIVGLASVLDVMAILSPVADRRERSVRSEAALPRVQKHRLARLRPQTLEDGYGTIGSTNILAVGNKLMVLVD